MGSAALGHIATAVCPDKRPLCDAGHAFDTTFEMTARDGRHTIPTFTNVGSALMSRISFLPALVATAIMGLAPAIAQQPQQPQQPPPRPCAAIRQVCLQAGFVQNGVRAGEGVVVDCIRPIMMGMAQRTRAAKPLPAVDPGLVEACRAQNPNFGMGNAQRRNGPGQAPGQMPGQAPGQPPQGEPGPSAEEPPPGPPPAPGQAPQQPPAQH
jgi:hypothetical protein